MYISGEEVFLDTKLFHKQTGKLCSRDEMCEQLFSWKTCEEKFTGNQVSDQKDIPAGPCSNLGCFFLLIGLVLFLIITWIME